MVAVTTLTFMAEVKAGKLADQGQCGRQRGSLLVGHVGAGLDHPRHGQRGNRCPDGSKVTVGMRVKKPPGESGLGVNHVHLNPYVCPKNKNKQNQPLCCFASHDQ